MEGRTEGRDRNQITTHTVSIHVLTSVMTDNNNIHKPEDRTFSRESDIPSSLSCI